MPRNSAFTKRCLVLCATVDLLLMMAWCVTSLLCKEPTWGCWILLPICLSFAIVCLVCIYAELCFGKARLYSPYYAFLYVRNFFNIFGVVSSFNSLVMSNFVDLDPEGFACFACSCKCAPSNSLEVIVLLQRSLLIHFFLVLWCYFLMVLIRYAVPDAIRVFRARQANNPQQQQQQQEAV